MEMEHLVHELPQFTKSRKKVAVTILKVIDPAHYVLREARSLFSESDEADAFLELEEIINEYYQLVEQTHSYIPSKDEIIIIQDKEDDRFYRAKLKSILGTTTGPKFNVELIDRGLNCLVGKDRVFQIQSDFLKIPRQAVHFYLFGLKPLSLAPDPNDICKMTYQPAETWDQSAIQFAEDMWKTISCPQAEVLYCQDGSAHGFLYIEYCSQPMVLNHHLTQQNFAYFDQDALKFLSMTEDRPGSRMRSSSVCSDVSLFSDSSVGIRSTIVTKNLMRCERARQVPETIASPSRTPLPKVSKDPEYSAACKQADEDLLKLCEMLKRPASSRESTSNSEVSSSVETFSEKHSSRLPLHDTCVGSAQKTEFASSSKISTDITVLSQSHESPTGQVSDNSDIRKSAGQMIVGSAARASPISFRYKKLYQKAVFKNQNKLPCTEDDLRGRDCNQSSVSKNCSEVLEDGMLGKGTNDTSEVIDTCSSAVISTTASTNLKKATVISPQFKKLYQKAVLKSMRKDDCVKSNSGTELVLENSPVDSFASDVKAIGSTNSCDMDLEGKGNSTSSPNATINESVKPCSRSDNVCQHTEDLKDQDFTNISSQTLNCSSAHSISSRASDTSVGSANGSSNGAVRSIFKTFYGRKLTSQAAVEKASQENNCCDNVSQYDVPSDSYLSDSVSQVGNSLNDRNISKQSTAACSVKQNSIDDKGASVTQNNTFSEVLNALVGSENNFPLEDSKLSLGKSPKNINSSTAESAERNKKTDNYSLERYLRSIGDRSTKNLLAFSSSDENEVENDNAEPDSSLDLFRKNKQKCYAEMEDMGYANSGISIDFSKKSLYEKRGIPAIYMGVSPPAPITQTEEACFPVFLQNRLKELKFVGPSCIQSAVWPVMLRCRSFVAVSPKHSGKSVAYLLPLLSNIIYGEEYLECPTGNGPLAVIMCSSWKTASRLNEQALTFLEGNKKVSVVTACDEGADSVQKHAALLKGCDLLITTPSGLLHHLKMGSTNFHRISHFFLDDGSDVIRYHSAKLSEVMKELLEGLKIRKQICSRFQIGLCTERWTKGIAVFIEKFMMEELIIFTSFLEAAIYVKIPTYVTMCTESGKMMALLDLLDSIKSAKTVICVQNSKAAIELRDNLKNAMIYSLLVHEGIPHYELDGVKKQWAMPHTEWSPMIMVLSDPAIISINVTDATAIIHYDLPEISRLQYSYRYGCISDSIAAQNGNECGSKKSICHVLFSEACQNQAKSLVSILQRSECEVPDALKQRMIEQKIAEANAESKLCHYIKAYGSCCQPGCHNRHCIDEDLDQPSIVPRQGDICGVVSYIFDATHYAVKVQSYIDPVSMDVVSKTGDYAKLSLCMQDFYSNLKNCVRSRYGEPGSICAAKERDGIFHRAEVLEIIDEYYAKLFFIDEGWVRKCSRDNLFVLPDNLKQHPCYAFEVYLCNVKPSDPCLDWSPQVNRFVYDLIGGQRIRGKIVLCLSNILFLRPVVLDESTSSCGKETLNLIEVGEILKSHHCAINNNNHISMLQKACERKIALPAMTKTTQPDDSKLEVSWAYLDSEMVEDVYVSHIESPHRLYVQKAKASDSLDKLVADVTKKVQEKALKHCFPVKRGSYCVAEIPDNGMYYRGKVVDVIDKDGTEMARVLFVDYGDYIEAKTTDLYSLPKEFMLLPFQAIECELSGISPPHGGWADVAVDDLVDITRDDCNLMKILKVKAWKKVASCFDGNRYIVDIFNESINLSDYLVKAGYADSCGRSYLLEELSAKIKKITLQACEGSSSDSSSPVEHKDASALMCCVLAAMQDKMEIKELVKNGSSDQNLLPSSLKCPADDSHTKILNGAKTAVKSPNTEGDINGSSRLTSTFELPRGSLKPIVTWWNSLNDVTVTINLIGLKKYQLEISDTGFVFSAIVQGKFYCLEEKLYAYVINEQTTANCYGHGLCLIFQKQVAGKWPRLIASDKKVHYIKYDITHISDSDSENRVIQNRGAVNTEDVLPHDDDDEEDHEFESSESGGEEYVAESWTQLCESDRLANSIV